MHPKVCEAAKSGDYDSLITIISGNGEDLFHQTTPKENNILHLAAQYKKVNFIRRLLQCPSGQSLLWQGNYKGDTPLHVAAKVGSCEVVRMFIDLSKSPHRVVENEQVDACKELLQKQNLHKDTVLHYAIRGGHDLVVELLIGEEPQLCDITNDAFESPLYLAADRGLSRTIDLILRTPSLSSSHKGPNGLTALHAGISHSLTGWEKIMEKRPEAIKEGDDLGRTPLHYVAFLGNVKAVRLLLQNDTSAAYDLDKAGESALHLAAFEGFVNVIDVLVRSCPDACDIINTKGQSALHVAVIGGRENVVKYILGMPNMEDLINEQDNDGNTALHLAALHKKYNIIYIFAQDKRVDRLAKNKDHFTALDIFSAHKEVGYGAKKVKYLLGESHGIPGFQGWFIEYGKKRLDKQFVEGQPSMFVTTGSNIVNRDNFGLSKKAIMNVHLLVAVFIATASLSMTFAVLGAYNNDGPNRGMAFFAKSPSFMVFWISNLYAFIFSLMAIMLHCDSTTFSYRQEPRHIPTAGSCIAVASQSMAVAYSFGANLVLTGPTEDTGESILSYAALGYVYFLVFTLEFSDHETHSWMLGSSARRYIVRFLDKCVIQLVDFLAMLIYWPRGKLMSWAGFTVP